MMPQEMAALEKEMERNEQKEKKDACTGRQRLARACCHKRWKNREEDACVGGQRLAGA